MSTHRRWSDVTAMLRGLQLLARSQMGHEMRSLEENLSKRWGQGFRSRFVRNSLPQADNSVPSSIPEVVEQTQNVAADVKELAELFNRGINSNEGREILNTGHSPTPAQFALSEEQSKKSRSKELHRDPPLNSASVTAATEKSSDARFAEGQQRKTRFVSPELPKNTDFIQHTTPQQLSERSNERAVPSSRIARAASFGSLAFGLGAGAVAEFTRRTFDFTGLTKSSDTVMETVMGKSNVFLTPANVERIVQTLCKVRGAALKLGQMLSIQDSTLINPALLEILERVRYSADFMPLRQVQKVLRQEFGDDWRDKVAEFDEKPFAAASIGQVHRAVLHDGREVAVKIQYPGVADGIDSDIDNLVSVLSFGGLFPKGMFLEQFVKVTRAELKLECDYEREARAMQQFRQLILDDKHYYVPQVIPELTSKRVLTAELISGVPVDKCTDQPQAVRDYIATKFIELCLKEIFQWRFMQTDPNWSNFFFGRHPTTGEWRLVLLDFGAARSFSKKFVDQYMNIIKAAYDKDEQKMLEYSRNIGFLTGYESKVMERAHCDAILIMGETLASDAPYDFSQQNVTKRIHHLIPVMLEHRLTPPPEEIYSLHRKLSGSYLLATKLKANVACGPLFSEIHANYKFGPDNSSDIDIDNVPDKK
uniref:ABC1 atypical kinase-like domain-containing protein n=1 Tax=Plectus sambesii TaxID=2011161 RepID=A0A914VHS4_9BILA